MPKHQIKVGIIGGSGLGDVAKHILGKDSSTQLPSENVFGLPTSDIIEGFISGLPVALMSRHGAGHKISPSNVNYRANIEALRLLGCTHIVATTACGSLSESICPGQLVIPDSFLDRTYRRKGTLFDGTAEKYWGVRHVPMEPAFDPKTSQVLIQAATNVDIDVKMGGTIVTIEGPRFSSKAESKAMRLWGCDLVNMTTCPEVCLAKEAGILYASIAMATDYDCWRESNEHVSVASVLEVFKQNVQKVTKIIIEAIKLISKLEWDLEIDNLKSMIECANVSSKD